jgi:hypothetical protein
MSGHLALALHARRGARSILCSDPQRMCGDPVKGRADE